MRASEWQFLCAVHDQPKSCCAIDYCCHTLDWAANVVTNPKIFPSRFVALSSGDGNPGHDKNTAVKNLVNVFRRLHRIFAHAWFQHRGVFWSVEGQAGLYVFFKTVCDSYDLLPAENYKLPPEAEGLESASAAAESMERGKKDSVPTPTIKPPPDEENFPPATRTNTRRHIRGSPSTGSAVTTVVEADEDDSVGMINKLGEMHISVPPEIVEEEPEVADVPVIVEHGVMDNPEPEPKHEAESEAQVQEDVSADQPETQETEEPTKSDSEPKAQESEDSEDIGEADHEEGTKDAPKATTDDNQSEASNEEQTEAAPEKSKSTEAEDSEAVPSSISTRDFAEEEAEHAKENTKPDTSEESAEKEKPEMAESSPAQEP